MVDIGIIVFALIIAEFFISLVIASVSKNIIKILINIEILTITSNAFLVFFSVYFTDGNLDPFVTVIIMISTIVTATVAAFILIIIHRLEGDYNTLDDEKISELRW